MRHSGGRVKRKTGKCRSPSISEMKGERAVKESAPLKAGSAQEE